MDIASLLGIVLGMVMVVYGIISNGASIPGYLDLPSTVITIGGSLAGVLGSHKLKDFIGGFKSMALVFKDEVMDAGAVISNVINLANVARKEGLLALEEASGDIEDPFLKAYR